MVLQEAGGLGHAFWAVKFRKRKRQNGVYHVKIYITRRKLAASIKQMKTEEQELQRLLIGEREDLQSYITEIGKIPEAVQEMLDELKATCYLQSRARSTQVDSKVFYVLVECYVLRCFK